MSTANEYQEIEQELKEIEVSEIAAQKDRFSFDDFSKRHIGPNKAEITQMLKLLGLKSLDELVK